MATPLLHQLRNTHSSLQHINPSLLTLAQKPDPAPITKAITILCRAGSIDRARKLFDEMPDKNVVAFSSMIYGYAGNGLFSESLQLFSKMQESGVHPNSFTIVAILLCSTGKRALKLGESIHGRIVKSGLETNPFVRTALLDSYAKCGNIMSSYRLFKEMDSPSLVTCNAIIAGFTHNDLFEEALLLFRQLGRSGIVHNSVTMASITQSCIGYGSLRLCESMHGYIVKSGLDFDDVVMNSVFDMYLSLGNLEIATDFFRKMAIVDVVSWTAMMGFLLELEDAIEALDLFLCMRASGIDPDMVTMIHVITACALLGDLGKGRSVHCQIVVRGLGSVLPIMNSLITMYANGGDPVSARISFDCIANKSLVSWSAMVSGYVQNGQSREGLDLLIRMRKEETFDIDSIMLVRSLSACSELASLELCKQIHAYSFKSGVLLCKSVENSLVATYGKCGCVDFAQQVFEEMICHDIVSWNAMISTYGVNGEGEGALSLYLEMEKCGIEPDIVTYLNLLSACSHSGLVDHGLIIFEKMVKEKRIDPRGEHCGCVVDMLARAGRLEDARKLVSSLSEEVGMSVWKALLGGCQINSDVRLAEVAADKVFQMSSNDSSHIVTLSNVYASIGRFGSAEILRSRIGKKGLMKTRGFSLLDALPCDAG